MSNLLRNIPSLAELLESPPLKTLVNRASRNVVVSTARKYLEELRAQVKTAAANVPIPPPAELAQRIADWLALDGPPALVNVINATGTIVHDALGRVPLADEAIEAMSAVARGYANLELDLANGQATAREASVEGLLIDATGAEGALVVNNGTAALLLALSALTAEREVVIARGEVGELGGGSRLIDIVEASGCVLREVGATNRTTIDDYAGGISSRAAAILRVPRTEYEIVGATEDVALAELAGLARRSSVPLIVCAGSGALLDYAPLGLAGQLTAAKCIQQGADLVLFSGDKLLSGPQCGVVVGRRSLLERMAAHSLYRALRADKLRLAALAATLRLIKDPEIAERSIPVISLLSTSVENLRQRAERIAMQISATGMAQASVVERTANVLGTQLAGQAIPTLCVALEPTSGSAQQLAARLRGGATPVIGRVEEPLLLLDLRSVQPREDLVLVAALEALSPDAPRPTSVREAAASEEPNL